LETLCMSQWYKDNHIIAGCALYFFCARTVFWHKYHKLTWVFYNSKKSVY